MCLSGCGRVLRRHTTFSPAQRRAGCPRVAKIGGGGRPAARPATVGGGARSQRLYSWDGHPVLHVVQRKPLELDPASRQGAGGIGSAAPVADGHPRPLARIQGPEAPELRTMNTEGARSHALNIDG